MSSKFRSEFYHMASNNKNLVVILVFGIVYRLVMHFFICDSILLVGDSESYILLAEKINDLALNGYNGERTPGYPLLLFLAGSSLRVAVLYQHILGVISSVFMYKTFLNFQISHKSSLWLTLFFQCFLNVYFYEITLLTETLSLFLLTIIVYVFSKNYLENTQFKVDLLFGILLGILTLVKPFYAFIPFVFYGFIVLKKKQLSAILNKRIIILFFPLLVYFGWSYVNKINTGYFTSTTFFGLNLSQNCVFFAEKTPEKYQWIGIPYAKYREMAIRNGESSPAMAIWNAYEDGAYEDKKMGFADFSYLLGDYAVQTIKNNPKAYCHQVVTRSWFDFWRPTIPAYENKIDEDKKTLVAKLWFVQRKLFNLIKFGFLFLVPFYCFKYLKDKKVTPDLVIVILIFAASVLQGIITYGTNSRYSFPFEYLMMGVIVICIKNNFLPVKK